MSHPAAPAIPSRSDNQARLSPTPTAGILKHNDADITATPQNNRVSFSRRQDGSIQTHISSFDVDASPKETANRRLSLRESMNWPPPPPPRTNSADDSCRKSFSAAFRENRMPRLPFATVPACPPPGIPRPLRRYSTMEIEDLTRMNQVKVQGQATATCSMIPPLPFSRRRSDGHLDHSQQQSNNIRTMTSSGARCDYILGDIAKCSSHMIILAETTNDPQHHEKALHQVSQLKQHDFAFIKRADGSWTYAILAHRYIQGDTNEECMMFVLNEGGATKTIKKRQWVNFVRVVALEEMMGEEWIVDPEMPRNISVDDGDVDDFSMISFTSF